MAGMLVGMCKTVMFYSEYPHKIADKSMSRAAVFKTRREMNLCAGKR